MSASRSSIFPWLEAVSSFSCSFKSSTAEAGKTSARSTPFTAHAIATPFSEMLVMVAETSSTAFLVLCRLAVTRAPTSKFLS